MTPPPKEQGESQEEINILAAEFNLSEQGNETEMFAKALTLCQKFRKDMKAKDSEIEEYRETIRKLVQANSEAREMLGIFEDNGGHDNLGGKGYMLVINHMDDAKIIAEKQLGDKK